MLPWVLSAVVAAFYALFMVAVVSKYREARQARSFVLAPGKILASRSESRRVAVRLADGDHTELRTFAAIRYAFDVGGRTFTGSRITVSDDPGNHQVAEKLRRYPVGAAVTVFHDPERPSDCVLERDMAADTLGRALEIGTLIGIGGLLLIAVASGALSAVLDSVPDPARTSAAAFTAALGGIAGVISLGLQRRGRATYAWPKTTGQILSSGVETVRRPVLRQPFAGARIRALFGARAVYRYSVDGIDYQSDRTSYGAEFYASFRLLAEHQASRFVAGQAVDVFHDPRAPGNAVLRQGAPGIAIAWATTLALFAIAARFQGLI